MAAGGALVSESRRVYGDESFAVTLSPVLVTIRTSPIVSKERAGGAFVAVSLAEWDRIVAAVAEARQRGAP